MSGVTRRRFLKGTGAALLASTAGCLSSESVERPVSKEALPDEVSRILEELTFYQKSRLERYNELVERYGQESSKEHGFSLKDVSYDVLTPYDPESVQTTLYPGGSLEEQAVWDTVLPDDESDGFDIRVDATLHPDSPYADMTEEQPLPDRSYDFGVSLVLETGMAAVVDPLLYIPVSGQQGEAYFDPEDYRVYEDNLSGIECNIHDHAGNTATAYFPEEEVEKMWGIVAEQEKDDSFTYIRIESRQRMEVPETDSSKGFPDAEAYLPSMYLSGASDALSDW